MYKQVIERIKNLMEGSNKISVCYSYKWTDETRLVTSFSDGGVSIICHLHRSRIPSAVVLLTL